MNEVNTRTTEEEWNMNAQTMGETPAPAPAIVGFPSAKPSQILRSLTRRNWCKRHIRLVDRASVAQHCAIGRLADEGGFDWAAWDETHDERSNAARFVRQVYGLKTNQVKAVMYRNDVDDLDAVIEFLEKRGM
jgi:hypothetical protein